jgi:hypothetical protein
MKSPSRDAVIAFFIATFIIATTLAPPVLAKTDKEPSRLPWLDGFTLIELETEDVASMYLAKSVVEAHGGQVAILSPPSLLMGWVPPDRGQELVGKAGIKHVFFTDVLPGEVRIRDEQTRQMVRYFNRVVRGEYQEDYRLGRLSAPAAEEHPLHSDAWDRGELEQLEYEENLSANGFNIQNLKDRGLLLDRSTYASTGNSDRMMGTVATTLIFVESDGSGTDPDTYTWTDQHVQDFVAGANTGMAWWSAQARNYNDCWVAFFVRYVPPTDPRCQQWREMVLHPSGDVAGMASEIMANFGYTSGGVFTRVTSFNSAQRATYGTDWSYTGFIAYNPPPAGGALTDGVAAFAYRGGPYTFCLYRSFGWAPEQVFAHESGHIFWACDEYDPGCGSSSCTTVCYNGVVNGNCETCNPSSVACMMKSNSWSLCSYTDDHVGWQISPCAPAPFAPPTITSVFPTSGVQGDDCDLVIAGGNFLYGAYAEFGSDIGVTSSTVVGTDSLYLTVAIGNTAALGSRSVTVRNRDTQGASLPDAFEVLPSTRHYVSPAGGDVFPYLAPEKAAHTIADALAAADDGDTILVESASFALSSTVIEKAVTLSGAWNADFTQRDLSAGKTTLDLTGNIVINNVSGGFGIDGFIVENGTGSHSLQPADGDFGGGLKILNSTASVANCEIRQNQSGGGLSYGGGGGIFAINGTVTIVDSWIHDNEAMVGGGIYLYDCAVGIAGSTIEDNVVSSATGQPLGAGAALDGCSPAAISATTFAGNTGAQDGGGLWVSGSTAVSIDGGTFTRNTATFYGAAAYASGSEVTFDGTVFSRNTSDIIGGAVALIDTCDAALQECQLLWNTGLIGGGVYFNTGGLDLRYNLFVGNAASNTAGAVYVSGATSGEITGNTMDRNDGSTRTGGIHSVNSAIEMYNNIIVNSTGRGIACSGTLPVLTYNDVWNSSAEDYYDCTPGVGSISLDPVFVDTAQVDYHLGAHSPAIDAGRPGALYEDPDGSPGDMGWYGSHALIMAQPSYPKDLTAELQSGDVLLTWNHNPEPDIAYYYVYCDTTSGFRPSAANFVASVSGTDSSTTLVAPPDSAFYVVAAVDADGYEGGFSNEAIVGTATGTGEVVVYHNRLYQNVPNPFNPTTIIRYELRGPSRVSLSVYDVAGRMVRRLLDNENVGAGIHGVAWNGTSDRGERVSSGIYFYKLEAGDFVQTRKMLLLK